MDILFSAQTMNIHTQNKRKHCITPNLTYEEGFANFL